MERPKTPTIEKDIQPQPAQLPPTRDSIIPPHIPYPMFPAPFQSGPGLIPHPMFQMPMHKNMPRIPNIAGVPNSPAAIPGIMHPRFRPPLDGGRPPFVPPSFVNEPMSMVPSFPLKQPQQVQQPIEKQRTRSPDKEFPTPKPTLSTYPMPEAAAPPSMLNTAGGIPPPLMPTTISPVIPAPLLPPNISLTKPVKPEKDKSEKVDQKNYNYNFLLGHIIIIHAKLIFCIVCYKYKSYFCSLSLMVFNFNYRNQKSIKKKRKRK